MQSPSKWAETWIRLCAEMAREHRGELIELDRVIGDGDHGENLDRGFAAAWQTVSTGEATEANVILATAARSLLFTVGGASGPLLGSAFLGMSKVVTDVDNWDANLVVTMLETALAAIQRRGQSVPGDKTMVDTWAAAVKAARELREANPEFSSLWLAISPHCLQAAADTAQLQARRGRASYLGERSIGHIDPGAQSSALIIQAAAKAAQLCK